MIKTVEVVMAVGKFRKKFAGFISSLIPFRNIRSKVRAFIENPKGAFNFERMKIERDMWRAELNLHKNKHKFKYNLSVVAIMKDEGPYLREWIEYYKLVGVEKFYLYNNGSTDDTVEILAPYVKSGLVELIDFPGEKMQLPAYADWLSKYKNDTKWVAVIDLDEFIVPIHEYKITDILDKLPTSVAQIIVHWVMFGSNGHVSKPDGLVIESYTKRDKKKHYHYKSIVNPRLAHSLHVHKHDVIKKTRYMKFDVMRINHYFCKSWEEYSKRAGRGSAFRGVQFGVVRYTRERFEMRDKNDVEDRIMDKYLAQLRKNLRK